MTKLKGIGSLGVGAAVIIDFIRANDESRKACTSLDKLHFRENVWFPI